MGSEGDQFLVKIDGRQEPLKVKKTEVFALNQPQDLATSPKTGESSYRLGGWWSIKADYDDPLTKAKLGEAAVLLDPVVSKLDFTKLTEADRRETLALQKRAVGVVHDTIDMMYPDYSNPRIQQGGRTHSTELGRAAMKGIGMCREQAGVMLGMLAPFQKALGVDVQFIDGQVLRTSNSGAQIINSSGSDHGWLHVVYRPTMEVSVVDRTWGQRDIRLDAAYSKMGDRYPARLETFMKQQPLLPTDEIFDGKSAAAAHETELPKEGEKVGRENHMRNWQ
jgi:hypothetical protein